MTLKTFREKRGLVRPFHFEGIQREEGTPLPNCCISNHIDASSDTKVANDLYHPRCLRK